MNQIDEIRPGAGREIERTWQRLRAQDAAPYMPQTDRNDTEGGTPEGNGMHDEANEMEEIVDNDDLVQPEMLDDPLMNDGDLGPYDDRVPTDEPEYGDHPDSRTRQDNEAIDADLVDSSRTTV